MSTPQDRLEEIHAAYAAAMQRRFGDLKLAQSEAEVRDILNNVRNLEGHYLKAAAAALSQTGPDVEAALQAAQTARSEVDAAYAAAQGIAEKIRLVSRTVKAVGELVKKAQG